MNLVIFLPHLDYGGISRTASDLSCRLPPGVKQHIVLLQKRVVYPYCGHLHILGENCQKPLPIRGLRLLLNAIKFRRILKKIKPDVVLAFHHDARAINLLAGLFLPGFRYRTVIVVLGVHSQSQKYSASSGSRIHNLLVHEISKHAHQIIACTEGVKRDILDSFKVNPSKVEVLPSAVDVRNIRQMALDPVDHPWFSDTVPVVINVGRFSFEKNQCDLMKAFALVRKQKACRLVLVGDGQLKDNLERLAADLEIHDNVFFTGFQDNPFKFVARAEVFVFPSLHEAQGIALLEALAVGCPIVAYDCPVGPREILAPGGPPISDIESINYAEYGALVPVGNVELLAEAIIQILSNAQLRDRYARGGIGRALHFNMKSMVDGYLRAISFSNDASGVRQSRGPCI